MTENYDNKGTGCSNGPVPIKKKKERKNEYFNDKRLTESITNQS